MRDIVWLREGFPPFRRLARLTTASAIDRSYGLMTQGQAIFTLSRNDLAIADVQRGRMVEIQGYASENRSLPRNQRTSVSQLWLYYLGNKIHLARPFLTEQRGIGTLTGVQLCLLRLGSPTGSVHVHLYDDNGGEPGNALGVTGNLDVTSIGTSEAWYTFTFSSPITLVANTFYHVVLDSTNLVQSGGNLVGWRRSADSDLPGETQRSYDLITWDLYANATVKLILEGSWLAQGACLPAWVGWVEKLDYVAASGLVTVNCIDGQGKLAERHSGLKSSRSGAAGLIARDLLYQANARNGFGIMWDILSEAGMPVEDIDVGGSSLFDALNTLADVSGDEWWIRTEASHDDLELYLHWGHRRGHDLSQSIYLREGYEISNVSYSQDTLEEAESTLVLGAGGTVEERPATVRAIHSPERVIEVGALVQPASETLRRQVSTAPALAAERVIITSRQSDIKLLSQLAENDLELPLGGGEQLRLTVNTRADWRLLDVGNIVRVKLESVPWGNLDRRVRLLEIQPDVGTLDLEVQVLYD